MTKGFPVSIKDKALDVSGEIMHGPCGAFLERGPLPLLDPVPGCVDDFC